MPAERCAVLIVGGGMVGAALAAALADTGLAIVVLDTETPRPPVDVALARLPEVESRVSALTPASQALLASVGAWPRLSAQVCAYDRMQVWDADGTGSVDFDAADTGQAQLGWIAGNQAIAQSLRFACGSGSGVHWRAPARLAALAEGFGGWRATLADGQQIEAGLLVGADGAQSLVREQLGIGLHRRDYGHRAIVATVVTERAHENRARQRFIDSGPLAFLPLPGGEADDSVGRRHAIVWSCQTSVADRLLALDDAAFARELAGAFEFRLGAITVLSARDSHALVERTADRYVVDGLNGSRLRAGVRPLAPAALIGDAVHTVHPLAGQGVNLGFLDAATLAEEIGRNLAAGLPFNEALALRRYERRRKWHNLAMQQSFAGLKWLFGARELPLRWVRNAGLSLVDRSLPLKVLAARTAMGLDGDLPACCRQPLRGAQLGDNPSS